IKIFEPGFNLLRTRSCSRSASHGKPRRQRKPGPAGPFVPRGSGCADPRGAGPRCPRSAPGLPADPPRGCSARYRGAGTGAARRSRALREAAGPVPVAAGTCGSLPPFCSDRRSARSIPGTDAWKKAIGAAGEPRPGQDRAGRPRGGRCGGPRSGPGRVSGRKLTKEKRIPRERGARRGRGGRRRLRGPVAAHPPGARRGRRGGLGADPVLPASGYRRQRRSPERQRPRRPSAARAHRPRSRLPRPRGAPVRIPRPPGAARAGRAPVPPAPACRPRRSDCCVVPSVPRAEGAQGGCESDGRRRADENQAEEEPDEFHPGAAERAGKAFRRDPLPGRVHAGGAEPAAGALRGQGAGVVPEPPSQVPKAGEPTAQRGADRRRHPVRGLPGGSLRERGRAEDALPAGKWARAGGRAGGRAAPGGDTAPRALPLSPQVQAQLQLDSAVAHAHHHLHPHLAHAPYMMFPAPPFGLPLATLAESASAASVVAAAAAAKTTSKNSSIADLRLKAKKHAAALGL
uniref:SHOX homeobox 2 n=1 Tax=Corvus moneduloides TaxID=1196302 RepID=A0A8U7MJL1_CORMO